MSRPGRASNERRVAVTGSPDDGAVPGRAAPDVPAVPDIPESAAGTGDASGAAPQRAAFRVDLRGMVDLLSRNLYSGPRVYVRELLQNAVDAIAARRALEPGCPGRISIELSRVDGVAALRCADTGIGLTPEQAAGLLSTVGPLNDLAEQRGLPASEPVDDPTAAAAVWDAFEAERAQPDDRTGKES